MSSAVAKASPKKRAAGKPKAVQSHPPYDAMVKAAIKNLKESKGSSRQSIQKYILANYKFADTKNVASRLRISLRKLSDSGVIKHAKGGTGASGSFKLGEKALKAKSPKKPRVKKVTKPKAAGAKKSPKKKSAAKKAAASAAPAAAPKPKKAAASKPKSPKKAKKSPTKKTAGSRKPKSPKKKTAKK